MAFWNRIKNWEDDYDEQYTRDRPTGSGGRGIGGTRFFAHSLSLLFLGAIFLGAVGAISGTTMMEKMLTDLAMPLGIVWLALIVMVYFSLLTRQAWPALVGFFCLLILTVAGNSFFSNWLISTLEQPYADVDIYEMEPLDTLVVLGGGTSSRLDGESQLAAGGDRVATTARLYHAGLATKIICTGSKFRTSENDRSPREEAAAILVGMGVPGNDVLKMKGSNTFQEIGNLKKWIEANPDHGRVGIVSSAWHLPRVMRLAK
jgi:uncharacterized SAM-binding protein YcdF (DUF218 family)